MCCISWWMISVSEFYNLFCVLFSLFVIFCIQCGILQFNLTYSVVLRKNKTKRCPTQKKRNETSHPSWISKSEIHQHKYTWHHGSMAAHSDFFLHHFYLYNVCGTCSKYKFKTRQETEMNQRRVRWNTQERSTNGTLVYTIKRAGKRQRQEVESKTWHTRT